MAAGLHPTAPLVELASGVDALYLSGRGELAPAMLSWLDAERETAVEWDSPVPLPDLGLGWEIEPRSFGRYRYRLSHPNGLVGITKSEHLPAFRVQPRAEFIHGEGCGAVLDFFDDVCDLFTASGVTWSLSRLDLFCDLQGWDLAG